MFRFGFVKILQAQSSRRTDSMVDKTCYASTVLIAFRIRETTMALAKEDIEEIKELIVAVIAERRPEMAGNNVRYELEIRERIVRVEEELKHQRELMLAGFKQMEKRFEQVDKRFEQLIGEMNARFAQVDKRFEQIEKRFEQIDKRFEQVDKRFEQIEKRFEQIDKRFEVMTARIDRFMVWSFATTLTVGGIVIAVIKYLP